MGKMKKEKNQKISKESIKENEILDKRFKEYLSKFELDEDYSEESKQILVFLKNQI